MDPMLLKDVILPLGISFFPFFFFFFFRERGGGGGGGKGDSVRPHMYTISFHYLCFIPSKKRCHLYVAFGLPFLVSCVHIHVWFIAFTPQ